MGDWNFYPNAPSGIISSFSSDSILGTAISRTAPTSAAWPSANRALFVPFRVWSPVIAVNMFVCNGGPVSGNLDMGIYSTDGGRLVSKGSTAHAGVSGTQVLDITDTELDIGLYYMALVFDNGTGQIIRTTNNDAIRLRILGAFQQASAFPLSTNANPASFSAVSSSFYPLFGIGLNTTI